MFSKFLSLIVVGAIFVATTNIMLSQKYQLSTEKSKIEWDAKKVVGGHNGVVNVLAGSIEMNGKEIANANFTVDMPSIKVLDLTDPGYNGKLTGHLKSEDFFSTDKFKTSIFTFKSSKLVKETKNGNEFENTYEVNGDLNIKGKSNPVALKVLVKSQNGNVEAYSTFKVDRLAYDIKYGSKNFFEGLGDKAIDNEFTLKLSFVFIKS
jgi:polyisoprenoid-binding protein YceI